MPQNNKKLHILLTSVGRRVELVQAFRAAGEALGIKLTLTGADMSASAPALMYCGGTLLVPRISDPAYIPTLLAFCRENRVDALIPTIDTDLLLLAKHKDAFLAVGTQVCVAAPEKVALCRDKRLTGDYFRSLGLHAPEAVDDISHYTGGFPAFIKPLDGSSSIGADRADTAEELARYAAGLNGYIVQPFVKGEEYTVDILCGLDGKPIYITPRQRLAVRSGEVLKTKIAHDPVTEQEMLRLSADFAPVGGITVQLIRDDMGINHYIEINPRFGGGAPLSMKAGADSAGGLLRCLMGENLPYQPEAAAQGAVYSRFDQCVCVEHGQERVRAVVFDLDDTLYNEIDYVKSGYKAVAKRLGMPEAEAQLWEAFQKGLPAIDTVLVALDMEDAKAACLEAYRSHMPDISLNPGARELLEALRSRGIKTAILTDGRPEGQRNKLAALGLEELVDSVLVTDELGGAQFRKPCDIGFRVLQKRLGIPFGQMLYVGDNPKKDFDAPRQLGMQYLQLGNPQGLYSGEGADFETVITQIWERIG